MTMSYKFDMAKALRLGDLAEAEAVLTRWHGGHADVAQGRAVAARILNERAGRAPALPALTGDEMAAANAPVRIERPSPPKKRRRA